MIILARNIVCMNCFKDISLVSLLLFILMFTLCSCETGIKTKESTVTDVLIQQKAKKYTDSIIADAKFNAAFDTVGLSKSPIKIISSKLIKSEYSSYRDIDLTYKNVSGKKIDAIRFSWYGINAFAEPADMGTSILPGFGGGVDDDPLLPGKTRTSSWNIMSRDGKKIVLAWPREVAFTDGTKWNIGN